jgi:hypothetical protein
LAVQNALFLRALCDLCGSNIFLSIVAALLQFSTRRNKFFPQFAAAATKKFAPQPPPQQTGRFTILKRFVCSSRPLRLGGSKCLCFAVTVLYNAVC